MLQESCTSGRLPASCLPACLPVCLACLLTCLGCLARLLDSYLRHSRARARALQRWGRKVRLRRGLCNPSLSGASPSSFRRSFYFFLVSWFLLFLSHSFQRAPEFVSCIHTYTYIKHRYAIASQRTIYVRHRCRDTSNIWIPEKLRLRLSVTRPIIEPSILTCSYND